MRRSAVLAAVLGLLPVLLLGTVGTHRLGAQDATPGACPATSEEENAALVRRWYEEVWNERRLDLVDERRHAVEVARVGDERLHLADSLGDDLIEGLARP